MNKIITLFSTAALIVGVAQAAPISWTGYRSVGDVEEVYTTGTTVAAFNGTGPKSKGLTTGEVVVGTGVRFKNEGGIGNLVLPGGNYFTGFSSADPGYAQILKSIDYGDDSIMTIRLTGLREGEDYAIQYWYVENRLKGDGTPEVRTMRVTGSGTSKTGPGDVTLEVGGAYAIGTFTADGTTQDFTVISSEGGVRLTAYQLRSNLQIQYIPEPNSYALLMGFLGLSYVAFRRRVRL
ncbi:MAG: hypothetical protein ACSHYA_09025 [Opitutaceae bacterium]